MTPSQNQRVCEHVPAVLGTTEAMDERYGLQDYGCRKRGFWVVDGQTGSNSAVLVP
jgi:hypothetical protein